MTVIKIVAASARHSVVEQDPCRRNNLNFTANEYLTKSWEHRMLYCLSSSRHVVLVAPVIRR